MEQATNLFTKGLLCDTNPMVLDNNTLTDCLNGTLITMNGNEVVLLNDMGNRRVDNAFLPEGYEPVGIKEYGGIIYVAAYNPITNKSQIGSFPSPLLRYGNVEDISANEVEVFLGVNNDVTFIDPDFPDINFLKSFVSLTPFLESIDGSNKKVILHAGDKFTIYDGDLDLNLDLITNYNNIDNSTGKLDSPKNRKFTLSVGVLNSLNEFVDFTKHLLRWDSNNKIITFPKGTPDYIKFNTGYFIPSTYDPPVELNYTVLDLNFIKNRLKIAANTYAYKLVGPLYIKRELNVISNLTYNVYGNTIKVTRNNLEETDTEVYIETIYEYNCPDSNRNTVYALDNGNDKYFSFYLPLTTGLFNLGSVIRYRYNNSNEWVNVNTSPNGNNEKLLEDVTYNEESNLYKAIKYTKITLTNTTDGLMDLMIVPLTSYYFGIRNLSYRDTIDISKLNSDEIEVTDFRFYTNLDKNTTDITVGFKAYPKYRTSFKDLKISIYNYDYDGHAASIKEFYWGDYGYNGIKTFTWEWDESKKSHFYPVKITYTIDNSDLSSVGETVANKPITITRWIMTTKLLNDCYYSSSLNFVKDYGKYENYNLSNTSDISFNPIIENKLWLNLSVNITNKSDVEKQYIHKSGDLSVYKSGIIGAGKGKSIDETGTLVNDYTVSEANSETFESKVTKIYNENIDVSGLFLLDRNLYPYELTISDNNITILGDENQTTHIITGTANITKNGITADFTSNYLFDTTFPKLYLLNLYTYTSSPRFDIKKNNLGFSINYNTNFIGEEVYSQTGLLSTDIVIEKLFTSFYKYIHENTLKPYAAISAFSHNYGNEHCLYFSHLSSSNKKIGDLDGIDNYQTPYSEVIYANHSGSRIEGDNSYNYSFHFELEKEYINKAIDSYFSSKLCFVGTNNNLISNYRTFYNEDPTPLIDDPNHSMDDYSPCRPIMFWMKTQDGWTLLPLCKWKGNHSPLKGEGKLGSTGYFNMLLGFLGQGLKDHYDDSHFDDDKIEAYVRMRMKNFYFVGGQNIPKTVYCINSVDKSNIRRNVGTINIDLSINVKLSDYTEGTSLNYICRMYNEEYGTNRTNFFKNNPNLIINIPVFSKDIVFEETEEFSDLLESFNEQLKNNIIKTALEEYYIMDRYNGKSSDSTLTLPYTYLKSYYVLSLHFSDENGNPFNSDLLYINNNNPDLLYDDETNAYYLSYNNIKYKYIPNLPVQYDGLLPLVKLEYGDSGIDFMYCSEKKNITISNNRDSTHLYMGSVPTIPKVLLKNY